MKGERFIAKANFVPLTATGSSDKMSNPKKIAEFFKKSGKTYSEFTGIVPSKKKEGKMKTFIKKQRDEERPTLEVKTNGLPDLSLMPKEELDLLASGYARIINELIKSPSPLDKSNDVR